MENDQEVRPGCCQNGSAGPLCLYLVGAYQGLGSLRSQPGPALSPCRCAHFQQDPIPFRRLLLMSPLQAGPLATISCVDSAILVLNATSAIWYKHFDIQF